jgi:hypothetical protein
LYCIRTRNIQLHRQWMIRSYPFGMVFVFARMLLALVSAVWSTVAAACLIPSFVIHWRAMFGSKPVAAKAQVA